MKARTRITDLRSGAGQPAGHIEMPTLRIPERCHELCSWVVVRAGPGLACVSRLKYANSICGGHKLREVLHD